MKFGSLFSGVGGDTLGFVRAGHRPAWFAEAEPYPSGVLEKQWPDVPNLGDITGVDWETVEQVPLLVGGYPCQDLSNAHTNGVRRGLKGSKSGLWREFARAVGVVRPRWVVVENVSAFRRWVPDVRADLAGYGYASLPVEVSAGSFGAPHRRPRVFVVAHADGDGEPVCAIYEEASRLPPVPRRSGHWGSPPPGGFRMDDGVPNGVDRSRTLGNAIVPQVARWLGEQITAYDRQEALL